MLIGPMESTPFLKKRNFRTKKVHQLHAGGRGRGRYVVKGRLKKEKKKPDGKKNGPGRQQRAPELTDPSDFHEQSVTHVGEARRKRAP